MTKKTKLSILFLATTFLFYNCSNDDVAAPKYLDDLIGSWSPVVGLMTGEIVNGDYGKVAFTYNFGECNKENALLTFKEDGVLEFERYIEKQDAVCTIYESSKSVAWESVSDRTFIANGTILQLNNQGSYDEKDIYDIVLEPFSLEPDLLKIKNDTLTLFYDKIPRTNLYNTRFLYVRSY